jgi:ATP-dependent DNA helicase Rep
MTDVEVDQLEPTICDSPYAEMGAPTLVLAGPGTGKTYQIARRIQCLVDTHGVKPDQITVITFTREAARGMRSKLNSRGKDEYIEPLKQPDNILTMHALGFRIINENAAVVGLRPNVELVTEDVLRGGLMRDAAILAGFGEAEAKAAKRDKERASRDASSESLQIQDQYKKLLRVCNAVDYDDQIALACTILERDQNILDRYRASTRHLLVDEYQDINADQHRLIKLLTSDQADGLFAVGDDDQSVYGFRGGDPSYIRNFATDYQGAKLLQLQMSRRCLKNILDCAVAVVAKYDPDRTLKANPTYQSAEPGLVQVWNCPSEAREGKLIGKAIYAKRSSGEADDFFVLVPTRNYVASIAEGLTQAGVDHEIGTSGEESVEWQHLRMLRRWCESPSNLATRHVIEVVLCAGTTQMPGPRVKLEAKKALRHAYCEEIAGLWECVLKGSANLVQALEEGATTSEKLAEVWALVDDLRRGHASNDLPAFVTAARSSLKLFATIDEFYRCLAKLEAKPGPGGGTKSSVRILTFRNSKGLEADCVFIVGLEDNSIPQDADDAEGTAEEARMMFVAMTRAKKELHLLHARTRTGAATYKPKSHQLGPSVFVSCLPVAQVAKQYVAAESKKVGKK